MDAPTLPEMPAMRLVDGRGGVVEDATMDEVRLRRAAGEFVWIDLRAPGDDRMRDVAEEFGLHHLAVEDSLHFGQRPKAEDYDDHVFLVVHGANDDEDGLVEVHCFAGREFLLTVHRDACPPFDALLAGFRRRGAAPTGPMAVHAVVDALTDSFFPALERVDDELDALDARILGGDAGVQRAIFAVKRRLTTIARVVRPQRDVVGRLAAGRVPLPGEDREVARHLRDVHDHLLRIEDGIEVARELLNGATEVHLAAVSTRQGEVTKRLTLIATVFLPLTFITGYFGQNFPWLVDAIGGGVPFLLLGVLMQLAVVAGLVLWFRRRGWV